MTKKTEILCAGLLLIGATAMGTSALAVPCNLTQSDMQSLAHPACLPDCKPVMETGLQNLSPEDGAELCKARQLYAVIHVKLEGGRDPQTIASTMSPKDIPLHASRFWTHEESEETDAVVMAIIAAYASPHGQ